MNHSFCGTIFCAAPVPLTIARQFHTWFATRKVLQCNEWPTQECLIQTLYLPLAVWHQFFSQCWAHRKPGLLIRTAMKTIVAWDLRRHCQGLTSSQGRHLQMTRLQLGHDRLNSSLCATAHKLWADRRIHCCGRKRPSAKRRQCQWMNASSSSYAHAALSGSSTSLRELK